MKKVIYSICALLILASVIYVNRSYASIYKNIEKFALQAPSDYGLFSVGSASESLTYVAIGDSLTSGVGVDTYKESYPYVLAEFISQKDNITVHLIPVAVPGMRSQNVSDTLISKAIVYKPDLITLLVGVNDVHGNISSKEFRNNYKNILERLTQETNAKIYVINVPYIGSSDLISGPHRYYFMYRTEKINSIIKELTEEYNIEYIDLYKESLQQYVDNSYYSVDLFHLGKKGYAQWANLIYANFSN